MSEFEELLVKVAKVLETLAIPYIVTGGAGVVVWGKPRFTADIDIAVELGENKITPLVFGLRKELGDAAYIDEDMIRKEQARGGEFNVLHPQSGLKVDFFVRGNDPFEKQRIARGIEKKVGEQTVRFIAPEDLILVKLRWYKNTLSTRHLEDAQSVVNVQGDNLDKNYLKQWAQKQGTTELLQQLLE